MFDPLGCAMIVTSAALFLAAFGMWPSAKAAPPRAPRTVDPYELARAMRERPPTIRR